jgi:hypothetical protein
MSKHAKCWGFLEFLFNHLWCMQDNFPYISTHHGIRSPSSFTLRMIQQCSMLPSRSDWFPPMFFSFHRLIGVCFCRNPTLGEVGGWNSHSQSWGFGVLGTSECLGFDSKAQNTSHWGVLGVIGKVLKRRCRKCPRIGHLDIGSPSYGQKKSREWQFDSWPLKVKNQPLPDLRIESARCFWKDLDEGYNFGLDLVAIRLRSRGLWAPKVPGLQPG